MRTRSSSQGGGDTTACASSSAGGVSAGKRRKTATHEEHAPPAKRPRGPNDPEAEPHASVDDAERPSEPATSAGPATAELQGVPAPDPGVTCPPVCTSLASAEHYNVSLDGRVIQSRSYPSFVSIGKYCMQGLRWMLRHRSRSGVCSSRNTRKCVCPCLGAFSRLCEADLARGVRLSDGHL
jgi:hypothetical protein